MDSPSLKTAPNNSNYDFHRFLEENSFPALRDLKPSEGDFSIISKVEEEGLKNLFPLYQDLKEEVNGLDQKINNIVKQQNQEHLEEFHNSLEDLQDELKQLKKKYEDFMLRNNGDEYVVKLQKEIKKYKEAAEKLDDILVKKEKHTKVLQNKIEFLEEERRFLNDYITNAVRKNKLISIERHTKPPKDSNSVSRASSTRRGSENRSIDKTKTLDMSLQDEKNDIFKLSKITPEVYHQDLSNVTFEIGVSQVDDFLNDLKNKDFSDKYKIMRDLELFFKDFVTSFERKAQESKKKIWKEKVKLDAMLNSKLVAKTQIAKIFEDCIEKVRLLVEKRRLDGMRMGREGYELAEKKAVEAIKSIRIDHRDFLSQDKEKLLEFFVFNETVLSVVKYLIAGGKDSASKHSPKEKYYRKQNQSMGNGESMLSMIDNNDSTAEPTDPPKEKRKSSQQPIKVGNLQSMSFNLPQIGENQKDGTDMIKDERKSISNKLEMLIGSANAGGYSTAQVFRRKDVAKNQKF